MSSQDRRKFLQTVTAAAAGAVPFTTMTARAETEPLFRISLAQWTLVKEIKSEKIDNLDFAKVAADHKIEGLEYVNQFFMDKAKDTDYLAEMKLRADDAGVKSLIIMCDREGKIGDPDVKRRNQTVENHRKWLDAAKALGCHSIRVNAGSLGPWKEQVRLVSDGLARLTNLGAEMDLNVVVENHGGLSSNGEWLTEVITKVDHERCGTLPDFGNFRVSAEESYDSYRGVKELMPFAKGVSVKDLVWDDYLKQVPLNYEKMLTIVLASGFRGFCGIEHGGFKGLNASRERLEKARTALAETFSK